MPTLITQMKVTTKITLQADRDEGEVNILADGELVAWFGSDGKLHLQDDLNNYFEDDEFDLDGKGRIKVIR